MGKGPGEGSKWGKDKGGKGSKGTFQGECYHCRAYGHRVSECHKKTAEMKGKGKGKSFPPLPGWEMPSPYKGKGKGNKGSWNPGKGAWGKGGKGAYGLEDDWSEGYSGYAYGHEDMPLFSLAGWQTPDTRKPSTNQPPASWHAASPQLTSRRTHI